MNKIIRGRRYDTEKAESVGFAVTKEYDNFEYRRETLYRKRTGEFFLYGEGGAKTEYRKRTDTNIWEKGEAIKPLSYSEAREWAEKSLDGDEYEKIFGEVDEDGEKRIVVLSVDAAIREKMKQEAVRLGISVSALVSEWAKSIPDAHPEIARQDFSEWAISGKEKKND